MRIAILLWYLFVLCRSIQQVKYQADQIKDGAINACTDSENYVNTFLNASYIVAKNSNEQSKILIREFLNGTADVTIKGNEIEIF